MTFSDRVKVQRYRQRLLESLMECFWIPWRLLPALWERLLPYQSPAPSTHKKQRSEQVIIRSEQESAGSS